MKQQKGSGGYMVLEMMSVEYKYEMLLRQYGLLQAAAQKVVDETDRLLDDNFQERIWGKNGSLAELRALLLKQYGARAQELDPQ